MNSWLIVSKDHSTFRVIRGCYKGDQPVTHVTEISDALNLLRNRRYDFVFIDIALFPQESGSEAQKSMLQQFWHLYPTLEIIVMAPAERIRDAVMAVKAGASNYLTYPLNPEEIVLLTESSYRLTIMQSELDYLRAQFWQREALDFIHTDNPVMKKIIDKVQAVAPTKSTVLLTGETGTGKGVLAKLIHHHSNRRQGPFIAVHCGAIPETLIESELFGHEKGAFTGAVRKKLGKFEIAREGTIFLDEIGTIPPPAQVKLLQVLQDGTFNRVGGEQTLETQVRVIAATNMNLKEMCASGHFRSDLYYRLNVFPVEIPALRERKEDIPFIVDVILKRLDKVYGKGIKGVDACVLEAFQQYSWPGNIRELENLLERAYILEQTALLTEENFPPEVMFLVDAPVSATVSDTFGSLAAARKKGIEEAERTYLLSVLSRNTGSIKRSAAEAGVSTRQLNKLMNKYGIHKEDFRKPGAGTTGGGVVDAP